MQAHDTTKRRNLQALSVWTAKDWAMGNARKGNATNTPKAGDHALWSLLRGRSLARFGFTQEFPIGPYVADFACRDRRLVIEVEGRPLDRASRDRVRDECMVKAGYAVYRVPAASLRANRAAVRDSLLAVLEERRLFEDA